MPNVAINGLGRIGRAALKILLDADGLNVVAINDVAEVDNLAFLLRYDTVYGRYHRQVGNLVTAIQSDAATVVQALAGIGQFVHRINETQTMTSGVFIEQTAVTRDIVKT